MMRCRRCNQLVAMGMIACICGEIAKAEVNLYVNPDQPHTHDEQRAPEPLRLTVVQTVSTSSGSSSSSGVLRSGTSILRAILP
jgi:hypothetical protein